MPTQHNTAKNGDIAKIVLVCGDPNRAKFIAENFLEGHVLVNSYRQAFCYTGTYNNVRISVMGVGMGIPSIAIYITELYRFYDVEVVIRIGSTGSLKKDIKFYDLIMAQTASTNASWADQYGLQLTNFCPAADFELLSIADSKAKSMKVPHHVGHVMTSDIFYDDTKDEKGRPLWRKWADFGMLAVEMEIYGLYAIAAREGKKALAMASVSDMLDNEDNIAKSLSTEEIQKNFRNMMIVALDTSVEYAKKHNFN